MRVALLLLFIYMVVANIDAVFAEPGFKCKLVSTTRPDAPFVCHPRFPR